MKVTFDYQGSGKNIAILHSLTGQRGWLTCSHLTVSSLETEDHLVFAGATDSGEPVDEAQCRRLFDMLGTQSPCGDIPPQIAVFLSDAQAARRQELLGEMATRNGHWFETEMDKLDHWAEDRRASLKAELAELDEAIKEGRRAARLPPNLPEKVQRQRELRTLETKRDEAWRDYDQASRVIDQQKDALLDEISQRLSQNTEQETLFALRWQVV